MTAKKILELIENVDPSGTKALDEIDDLVRDYVHGERQPYLSDIDFEQYTRSRDALKAIRPEGWLPRGGENYGIFLDTTRGVFYWLINLMKMGYCEGNPNKPPFITGRGATEELAELHAIIQAIDYERSKGG